MPRLGVVETAQVVDHPRMSGYLATLDGMRGIAAIGVVAHHTGNALQLAHGFHRGYLFVPFFFTLSGFVVAQSYERKLLGTLSLSKFVAVRLIRLMPMIWLSALIDIIFGADIGSGLLAIFVIPSFLGGGLMFPANSAEWSLFFELVGNFIHALAIKSLSIAVLVGVLIISLIGLAFASLEAHSVNIGWLVGTFWGGAFLFTSCYVSGILIYRWHSIIRQVKFLRLPYPAIIAVFILSFLVHGAPDTVRFGVLDMFCAVVIFPLLIVAASLAEIGPTVDRYCRWLGALSYPLYISHLPIVDFLGKNARDGGLDGAGKYVVGVGIVLLTIALALIALRFYDEPLRARLSKLARH